VTTDQQHPDDEAAAAAALKLARQRRHSRIAAAVLLLGGVSVAVIDILATRAHSQTQSASASSSAAPRAQTATVNPNLTAAATIKPAATAQVTSANLQRAVRNPSQISAQNTEAAASPATNNITAQRAPQSTASASAASPAASARPKIDANTVIKKALPPAAVNWGQAVALNQRALTAKVQNQIASRLPKLQLDKTRLPVLLPRATTTLKATEAKMVSFGSAYSISLPQKPGLQVILYGHRSLVAADKGGVSGLKRSKLAGVAEDIFLSQTEDGWTGSFKRFGVVYTVDLSCDDLEAVECKDDGFIRKAIADLTEVSLGTEALKEAVLAGVKL
jgi:hypothetical protein